MPKKSRWSRRLLDALTLVLVLFLAVLVQRRHRIAAEEPLGDNGGWDRGYGLGEQAHEPEGALPGLGPTTDLLVLLLGFAALNALWSAPADSTLAALRRLGRGPRADNLFLAVNYRELVAKGERDAPEPGYLNAFDKRWAVLLLPQRPRAGTPLRAWTGPLGDGTGEPLRFSGRVAWSLRLEHGSPWVITHVWLARTAPERDEQRAERFLAAFAPHQASAEA